ncbi:MAG: 5-formyltetrahydrofolate cyclo-ligase [Verrucomicrobia bacterium]|nr:5-formyltetrahydrofolate cyclo-ligase [Verrucomicrobiota bacterium]
MQKAIQDAKAALRARVRAEFKRLGQGELAAASARARVLLSVQALWRAARSVFFFAPMPDEVDVWPLLAEALSDGKKVFLPRFVPELGSYEACQILDPEKDLKVGQFGIREPNSRCSGSRPTHVDLSLVPGIAFDSQGHRLGRGRGYYDKLLLALPGVTCGVAFDQQIVNEIPIEPHDVRLNFILTPTRWIKGNLESKPGKSNEIGG